MIDIIGKKRFYFIFSGLIIIPGIISLALWGLRLNIDFTGGTLLSLTVQSKKSQDQILQDIKSTASEQGIDIASASVSSGQTYLLRMKAIDQSTNKQFQSKLAQKLGSIQEERFETVGPTVGKETAQNALKAIIVASIAIIVFITAAFWKIPKPYSSFKFGVSALVALIHDVLVVIGMFSLFGHFFHVEVDSLFITALLTIMGFSVHDTIVVFDRIRENLKKKAGSGFAAIVNESILQTLVRSLSTSLTVIFTLFALLLFGGGSIHWFVVALLIGIVSGTYSSIFNAAPLLVIWEEWKKSK